MVLVLSACGSVISALVIRRWGRRGALVVEAATTGLVVRDAALIAGGAPGRLRRVPALLLWLELGAGIAASALGLRPVLRRAPSGPPPGEDRLEAGRVAAVWTLFALHTVRFWLYLQPDRGRRP
jgi:hypothetical protein